MVLAKALVESAVAMSQEEKENMFENYERIPPEEMDKGIREATMANLRSMMEKEVE